MKIYKKNYKKNMIYIYIQHNKIIDNIKYVMIL